MITLVYLCCGTFESLAARKHFRGAGEPDHFGGKVKVRYCPSYNLLQNARLSPQAAVPIPGSAIRLWRKGRRSRSSGAWGILRGRAISVQAASRWTAGSPSDRIEIGPL